MRARICGVVFIFSALLISMNPLAGQPGGGKDGKRSFMFQPGATPGATGQPGATPGAFGQPGATPGAFGQPGGRESFRMQMQTQPGATPGGFGQPGATPGGFGPPGGGFSRGGGMDPEMQWNMMLRITGGTDTLDLGRVPPDSKAFIKTMAERNGTMPLPDSGVWSKAQFMDFAARNQELIRAKQAGVAPGGFAPPGAAPGGFAPPGGFPMQPGGGRGLTDEDAARSFRERDRDGDGRLTKEEASDRTRSNWESIDTNRDNVVDFEEYRVYIAQRFGPGAQQGQPPFGQAPQFGQPPQFGNDFRGTGESGGPGRREEKKDDFSNVAIRYGKLPPGLPDWFAEYDQDKDGQVNMYEWRTVGGKTVAEFREKDANADGFIAPLELIRVETTKAEVDRLIAIQDGEAPATSSSRSKGGSTAGGKGGFPGFGGPTTTGKGGSSATESRPSRDEKVDRTKAGPWSNGGKK